MSKQRHNQKIASEFKGLKGWEIKYLKDSIKYGHLGTTTKQQRRYKSDGRR